MQHATITGATGMIGSALAARLCADGTPVTAIVNPRSTRLGTLGEAAGMRIVECPGSGYAKLATQADADGLGHGGVFYHFAWAGTIGAGRSDGALQQANVQMALDALKLAAALGCTRYVFAGSQAEYGALHDKFSADTPCKPLSEYGKAKLQAEGATRDLAHELGIEHIAVRIGSVYGPGDSSRSVLMQAIEHAVRGQEFACTAGEQLWDHLYCCDAAEALQLIGDAGAPDAIYPLGSGKAEPLADHIRQACKAGREGFEPSLGAIDYPPGQVMHLCADISQLQVDTGFQPHTGFAEGIAATAAWYRGRLMSTEARPSTNGDKR